MRESSEAERSSESPGETVAGTTDVPSVAYDTDTFQEAAASLLSIESGVGEHGLMIVFQDGARPDRQHAMAILTEHASPTVHQFQVPSLLGERRINTQNALRKAFDHAAEEDAVLYFEKVDALFSHIHAEGPDVDGEAAPTTVEYFLDRVDAYRGLIILCITDTSHESAIRQYTPPDLIVTFDPG
jgi:hypothetical protein